MNYRINIHTHSIFSDGHSSPVILAERAKELGFTALVLTDHFYGTMMPEFMSLLTMKVLKRAVAEAKKILPVIVGLEVPLMQQEVLVFGGAAIQSLLENGLPTIAKLAQLKQSTGCAVVLCHPRDGFEDVLSVVDGYERYNSGDDMFANGLDLSKVAHLPSWCNSDTHDLEDLETAYNIVDTKIETEADLIQYIRRKKQPEFFFVPKTRIDAVWSHY